MTNKSHLLTKRRNCSEVVWRLLFGITFIFPFSHTCVAADVTKRFLLGASVEHNSNPSQAESDKSPVWLYTLLPQFNLDIADGLNLWYLEAAMVLQQPSNNEVFFDRQDPRLLLGWNRTYQSGTYGIKVGYEQSAGFLLQLQSVGGIDNVNLKQRTKFVSAEWRHDFSARWSLINQAIYTQTKFDGFSTDDVSIAFIDFDVIDVKSRLAYAYTEKLNTYTELGYMQFIPKSFLEDVDLHRLLFGADYQVREGFAVGVNAGLYTLSGQQSDSGWIGEVLARYSLNRVDYSASLSRNLQSGLFGFQQIDTFQAALAFNVSEFNLLGAEYGLSKSKADESINSGDIESQELSAFYERHLSNRWKTRLSAAHRLIDVGDVQSESTLLGITLTYDTANF